MKVYTFESSQQYKEKWGDLIEFAQVNDNTYRYNTISLPEKEHLLLKSDEHDIKLVHEGISLLNERFALATLENHNITLNYVKTEYTDNLREVWPHTTSWYAIMDNGDVYSQLDDDGRECLSTKFLLDKEEEKQLALLIVVNHITGKHFTVNLINGRFSANDVVFSPSENDCNRIETEERRRFILWRRHFEFHGIQGKDFISNIIGYQWTEDEKNHKKQINILPNDEILMFD